MVTITITEHTSKSIQQLAEQLQKSPGEIVEMAIQEKLIREQQAPERSALGKHLADLGRKAAQFFPEDARTGDITADLYDERGLPK